MSTSRTYGDKPRAYVLGDQGEPYFIASEVGNYFRLFRGELFQKYSRLSQRYAKPEERSLLIRNIGMSQHVLAPAIILLKAREVWDIMDGKDEKYKSPAFPPPAEHNYGMSQLDPCLWRSSLPEDEISEMTEVSRKTVREKTVRASRFCNGYNACDIYENAERDVELVPIKLDMEVNGQKLFDTVNWNKNEILIKPEEFADVLCEDLGLDSTVFVQAISQAIRQQLQKYSENEMRKLNAQDEYVPNCRH